MRQKYYKQNMQTCKQFDATVKHIISACPILAKEQYINRHMHMQGNRGKMRQ